ncbi:MAG TPA: hypothetical protein VF058_03680 [Actinomycetota bacterium]
MRPRFRWSVIVFATLALAATALPAGAEHKTYPQTNSIHALGHSENPGFFSLDPGERDNVNSDLAFWGKTAIQGRYNGFRIIDISAPGNPKLVGEAFCDGDQGDVIVWENWVVRSWNAPARPDVECGGEPVPEGFEGFHVFDISDVSNPVLVDSVELSARPEADAFGCGSHTATGVPDLENGRLVIYNSTSGGPCPFIGVLELDLATGDLSYIRDEPLTDAGASHDCGAILGDTMMLACASQAAANVFSIAGSLEDPDFQYTITEPGVGVGGNWHSAAFTWDGEVIVLGWEPGGGGAAECEATDADVKKSMFFYDSETGAKLGQWTLERPQGADENCTIHNYNIVPLRSGRYVAVGGHYQAGTWVVDFTDPANAEAIAWADPESLGPGPFCGGMCQIGGAWSSYWYSGAIYESDITRGLAVYKVSHRSLAGSIKVDHLNPQTQEFTL